MATPVLTEETESADGVGTNPTTITFTPAASKKYLLVVAWTTQDTNGHPPGLTVTATSGGSNLADGPDEVTHNDDNGADTWQSGIALWKLEAVGSPSENTTLTIDTTDNHSIYRYRQAIVEVPTDATFAGLFAQTPVHGSGTGLASAGTTYSLGSTTESGRTVISFVNVNDDNTNETVMAKPSGWDELAEINNPANPRLQIIWRDDYAGTSIPVSQADTSYGIWAGIAVEIATGDTPVDLVPSDSVVTVVSDTGAITQTHALAPTDSVVTVVSDTGSVTQTHTLVGTDAVVAVVNDTGSITQTHALTGTDSVVTVVSDAGSITAGVQINPTDSVVTIVADTGSITQTHQIVGTDTHVVVVSDGGTITVGADIVGIDSVITIVSDTGAITQTHALAPTDSVVIVVSDPGTIIAEGDSLIQMRAGELTARWNATRLESRWEAPDLTVRWDATPLDPTWEAAELTTRWGASPLTE